MEITIVAVGKLRPYYRAASDDYLGRLRRYAKVREAEVREASRAPTVEAQQAEEAGRIGARIAAGAMVVALAREGDPWSSPEVARQVDRWRLAGRPVALVLGGSRGLERGFIHAAAARWSLGPLTLPHELARVVVMEQLYRAFTILRGEPYHKSAGA